MGSERDFYKHSYFSYFFYFTKISCLVLKIYIWYLEKAIPKKISKLGRAELEDILFWTNILENWQTPLGYSKAKKTKTHGNSKWVFLSHPCIFHLFFNWPLKFPNHALSSIPPGTPWTIIQYIQSYWALVTLLPTCLCC